MISYWLKSKTDRAFYHPEYHGKVFRLSEIYDIVNQFGIPTSEWKTDTTRKYDLFIEAQVWDIISNFIAR